MYRGVLERYGHWLDLPAYTQVVTLLEGNTPLIPMPRLGREVGCELFVKFEGVNPTGSFKDRGMTAAISEAAGRGVQTVICASTGNTAASAAAYAARAGMRAIVLIPEGKVAVGKLAGALAYGAEVIQVQGSFDAALSLVVEITQKTPITLVNSINPYRIEGQKTAAFEICDTLGRAPDWLCLPVGNAGNITSYWAGFRQYQKGQPRLLGVQAEGAAPLVYGHPIEHPETIATAIRIGKPARGEQALAAIQESQGKLLAVSDEAILQAQRLLASEGLWVEPASAAGFAGLLAESQRPDFPMRGKTVVVVCTGHGLKDPAIIAEHFASPRCIPAEYDALVEAVLRP
ncbi:MAG: threonine synthase [Anaerolineales bacterium]|nr:threonine synthase [Anaerolineales bacterium]MCX7609037.1 threonine synthase [Anaerolineales bacterium]MDW8226624.1 threonine synthase [Anaerolineales bacterium]